MLRKTNCWTRKWTIRFMWDQWCYAYLFDYCLDIKKNLLN